MQNLGRVFSLVLVSLFLSILCVAQTRTPVDETRRFLKAYVAGDESVVMSKISDDVTIYGSDVDEVFKGKPAVMKMLRNDQRLWRGQAEIGVIRDLSIIENGNLASVFFNSTFTLRGRASVPIRVSLVWKSEKHQWHLVQASNVVPTMGQSAEALLKDSSSAQY